MVYTCLLLFFKHFHYITWVLQSHEWYCDRFSYSHLLLPSYKMIVFSTCCHVTCRDYGRIILPHIPWHQVWASDSWWQQHLQTEIVQLWLLFHLTWEWHVLGKCCFFRLGPGTKITHRAAATYKQHATRERKLCWWKPLRVRNCLPPQHDLTKANQKSKYFKEDSEPQIPI